MRPQGQEKLGYFPTPPKTLEFILQMLAAPAGSTPQLLDPCAGEGRAVFAVAQHLAALGTKPRTWAIEIDYTRADTLARAFPDIELIHSPYQETVRSHNAWSLLWFNPPFDFTRIKSEDDSTGDDAEREHKRNSRTEHEFAKELLPNLAVGGIWVSLIPQRIATEPHVVRWHLANLRKLSVYKFPAEEFEAYGQLLIVGERQPYRRISVEADADLIALATERFSKPPDLAEAAAAAPLPVYTVPGLPPPPIFRRKKLDDEDLLKFYSTTLATNAHADPAIVTRTRPRAAAGFTPVIPLRQGHIASIVASGELGVLPVADYSKLLKGRAARKGIGHDKHGLIVDETASECERVVESFETQIVTLDRDGNLVVNDTLGAFERVMEEHAQEIAAYVARMFAPLYTEKDERNWQVMAPLLQTKGLYHRSERGLLPTQKAIVDAGVKCLRKHKHVLYVAEMGSGKSAIALATIECLNSYPAVVLCPAHLVEKWVREVRDTIPGANPMILKSASDITTFAEMFQHPAAKGVAIISKEKAKLGPGWKPDPMYTSAPAKWQERDRKTGQVKWVKRTWRVARCPKCGVMLDNLDLKKSKPNRCPNKVSEKRKDGTYRQRTCGEALYTFGTPGVQHRHLPNRLAHAGIWRSPSRTLVTLPPPDAEEPKPALHRWPLADLLVRQVKIGTLVADEVHQYKGKGTDQGRAFHILAAAAKYNIALTGTIFGGKAPDLFYLLYRLSSDFRRQFPYNGESLFTDLYGRREIHLAPEETDRYGRTTGKKRRVAAVRAIPGISPAIYAHTLKTMIITSLKDLHIPLPPYSEKIIRLEMTEWQRRQYDWVNDTLYAHIKRGFSSFDSQMMREAAALMSVYLQTTLSRPNSGFRTEEVWWKPKRDQDHVPYWVGLHHSPIPFHMQGINIQEGAATFVTADDLNLGDEAHEDLDADGEESNGANGTKTNTTRKARATDRTHPKTPPGMEAMTLHPAAPFEELLPKEEALIDLIRQEVGERRRVLVYVRQTGTRDIQPRLAHILKNAGIRASVLGAVEPTKREAWIDAQIATGAQVVITNPRKVETGLDLIQFQSLVFYELDYSLFTIWQAMRRVWRIGQTQPVRTYFLVYKNTMEDRALTIMGSKVKAAKTLYGDTTASALANEGETSDLMAELAKQILSGAPPASDGINSIFADETAQSAGAAEWSEEEPTQQEDTDPMQDPQDAITLDPGDYTVATPTAAAASPPPKKTLDMADIKFFSGLLDNGTLFCMGANDYGFPAFQDFGDIPGGQLDHKGFGLFCYKSHDGTRDFDFDAGGSMSRTPNGTHYTTVRVRKGEPPITVQQLRAVLQRHIEARDRITALQEEIAAADAKAAGAAPKIEPTVIRAADRTPKPDRRKISTITIAPGEVLRIDGYAHQVLYVSPADARNYESCQIHLRRWVTGDTLIFTPARLKNALDETAHAYLLTPGCLTSYDPLATMKALERQEAAAPAAAPDPEPEDEEEDADIDLDPLPDGYPDDLEDEEPADDEEPIDAALGDSVCLSGEDEDDDDPWRITKITGDDDTDPDEDQVTLERGSGYDHESVTYTRGELRDEFGINVTGYRAGVDKPVTEVYAGEDYEYPARAAGERPQRMKFYRFEADGRIVAAAYDINGVLIDQELHPHWTAAELEARFGIRLIDAPRPGAEPPQPEPEPVNIAARPAPFDINTTNLYELKFERDRVHTHLRSGEARLNQKMDSLGKRLSPDRLAATERSVTNERARLAELNARIAEVEAAHPLKPVAAEPEPAPETHVYKDEIFSDGKTSYVFRGFHDGWAITNAHLPGEPMHGATVHMPPAAVQKLADTGIALHDEPRPAPEPEPEPEPEPDPFAEVRWLIDLAIKTHTDKDAIDAISALIEDGSAMFDWWNDLVFDLRAKGIPPTPLKSGQIRTALREARNMLVANTLSEQKVPGTAGRFNSLASWLTAWRAVEQRERSSGSSSSSTMIEQVGNTLGALNKELIDACSDPGILGQVSAVIKARKRTGTLLANPRLQELHVVAQNRLQQLTTPPQPPQPPRPPQPPAQPGRTVDDVQHDQVKAALQDALATLHQSAEDPDLQYPGMALKANVAEPTGADADLAAWFQAWNALDAQPDSADKRRQAAALLHDEITKTVEACSDEILMATVRRALENVTDKRIKAMAGPLILALDLRVGGLAIAAADANTPEEERIILNLTDWLARWKEIQTLPDGPDKRNRMAVATGKVTPAMIHNCTELAAVQATLDALRNTQGTQTTLTAANAAMLAAEKRIHWLKANPDLQTVGPPPLDAFDGLSFYAPPLPTKRNAVRDQIQRLILERLREIKYGEPAKAIDWATKWNATPQARQKYLLEHIMRRWTQVPGMNNPGDEDVQVVFAHLIRHWKQIKALSAADAWNATHTRAQGAAVMLRKQIKEDYEADLRGGISTLPAFHTQLDAYIQTLATLHEIRQAMTRRRIQPPHLPLRHTQTAASLTAAKYPAWATGALFFGAEEHDDYAAIVAWRNSDDFQRVHGLRGVPVPQLTATLRKHHAETYPPPAESKPDKPAKAPSFAEAWAAKQGLSLDTAKKLADGAPATAAAFLEPGDD